MATYTNPEDAVFTKIMIPLKGDMDSREKTALAALLVRLLANAPLGSMSPEEQRLAALVEVRPF